MNMKGKLRKTLATQKQYTSGTGGGPALAPIDEAEGLLYDLVAPSVTARPNWFDDDGSDDEMPSCELPTEYLDDSFIESNCDINTTNSPPIANNLTQNTTPLIRNIPNPNENNPTTSRNPSTTHNTAPPLNNSPTSNFPRTRNRRRVKSVDNKIKEKQLEAIEERIKLTKLKQKAAKAMYLYYKNMGPPQASSDSD